MSGGNLGYFYSVLKDHAKDFDDIELEDLVKDLVALYKDREWFLSGDSCEGEWVEARNNFKGKWFGATPRMERIDKYLARIRRELFESFGLSDNYCKNCKHWNASVKFDNEYGECDYSTSGVYHRYESCDEFEKKG